MVEHSSLCGRPVSLIAHGSCYGQLVANLVLVRGAEDSAKASRRIAETVCPTISAYFR